MHPFTQYLRALDPAGPPPADAVFDAAWTALHAALRGELRRRGISASPPAYLGLHGFERWEEEALEELTAEAYSFIFVDRLRSLRRQLTVKENVEGLVYLNIRHFVLERQRQNDPLGYHVFEVLRSAVRAAMEEGDLHVLAGDPEVRNETVLGGDPDAAERAGPSDLSRRVEDWCADLLPDLVTGRGRRQDEVESRLRERLKELVAEGTFRFKDLLDPLKHTARSWWLGALQDVESEPTIEPRFVERDFVRLVACISALLRELNLDDKTHGYLASLWQFLRLRASDAGGALLENGEERLSHRRLAERLGIPRDRLPDLFAKLGSAAVRCRDRQSGQTSVIGRRHGS
jgi:hypothetical protein